MTSPFRTKLGRVLVAASAVLALSIPVAAGAMQALTPFEKAGFNALSDGAPAADIRVDATREGTRVQLDSGRKRGASKANPMFQEVKTRGEGNRTALRAHSDLDALLGRIAAESAAATLRR